jgi:hypothetical protein
VLTISACYKNVKISALDEASSVVIATKKVQFSSLPYIVFFFMLSPTYSLFYYLFVFKYYF